MSFRFVGWVFPLASLASLLIVSLFPDVRSRAVEIVIPLIAGLQAAFLFAPDDEPALELLLSSPRPAAWIIYERLAALLAQQLSIGLIWSLLLTTLPDMPSLDMLIVGWLPPTLLLVGLAVATTVMMRRSSFGVLSTIFVYAAMLFAGDVAVMQWNYLYPIHLFMQREGVFFLAMQWNDSPDAIYVVNRVVVTLVGSICVAWVIFSLRNEERVLGVGNRGQ
jgi:hypothetical protein